MHTQIQRTAFCWLGVQSECECRPPADIYPWLMRESGWSFGSLMNTVWEVEKPINIWHVSWICLHNWCRNLNWIIIASLWMFRPLSLPHYFSCPLYPTPHDISLRTKYAPFTIIFSHTSITHMRTHSDGCRQTINVISGCDWHMVLMNPLGSVSLCLPLCLWLTAVPPSLPPLLPLFFPYSLSLQTHMHRHTHTPRALAVSDITLLSSVVRGWHALRLMLMSNSVWRYCECVHLCVRVCEWTRMMTEILQLYTVYINSEKAKQSKSCGFSLYYIVGKRRQ